MAFFATVQLKPINLRGNMDIEQNIAIYQNTEGNINVEVKIINDDLWL